MRLAADLASLYADIMKVKAKLRSMDLRGDTVATRWGPVTFSREGLAELEVEEVDLQLLRNLRWLVEAPAEPATSVSAPPPTEAPPEPEPSPQVLTAPDVPTLDKLIEEPAPTPAFDLSDEKTPPQGVKKRREKR